MGMPLTQLCLYSNDSRAVIQNSEALKEAGAGGLLCRVCDGHVCTDFLL